MKQFWSIRMRASISPKNKGREIHISGAEGLYNIDHINKVVKNYIERALNHSKGMPDKIFITIEKINKKPLSINSLPITTVLSNNLYESERITKLLLSSLDISNKSINKALKIIKKGNMRGAAILTSKTSKRLDTNPARGIRVSRLGISDDALKTLSNILQKQKINNNTVREAIILASKVNSCKDVIAEICVSDDPDYTTGYIASKRYGYVRIPFIKKRKSKHGGRVFFVSENSDISEISNYLEKTPVMIRKISKCIRIMTTDELLSSLNN
jgi:6-carboxyhexanoate--CoA ligase